MSASDLDAEISTKEKEINSAESNFKVPPLLCPVCTAAVSSPALLPSVFPLVRVGACEAELHAILHVVLLPLVCVCCVGVVYARMLGDGCPSNCR